MADNSAIEWTDATWNPVTGCTKVSPGCDHCYAETFAERWRDTPGHYFEQGFDIMPRWSKLEQPLRWTKPRRIFVNSMSDLFHVEIPDSFIAEVFAVMAKAPQHTFQLLTKRHARMRALLSKPSFRDNTLSLAAEPTWPLPNVWLGVSVESQQWADIRIPALLNTPAAMRWLSCEPLLGPVNLARYTGELSGLPGDWDRLIDWVVVGGESGPKARPMHPDWPRKLRDQCAEAGVPYFFKQWGEYGELPRTLPSGAYDYRNGVTVADDGTVYQDGDLSYPDGPRYGEALRAGHAGRLHYMHRIGKKHAGRELDGRTHDEYPAASR